MLYKRSSLKELIPPPQHHHNMLTVSISLLLSMSGALSLISFDASHVFNWSLNLYNKSALQLENSLMATLELLQLESHILLQ